MIVRCVTDIGPQNCLVDTGAETSQVSKQIGRGLTVISDISVRGVNGDSMHATLSRGTIALGVTLEIPVVVSDLGTRDYSVIIGSDFLRNCGSVRIDYDHKLLIIGEN